MADNTNIILVGKVAFTDQGTWQSGYSYQDEDGQTVKGYDEGDIVHTSSGVFASLEDGNTTTPSDTNAKWRLWLDNRVGGKRSSFSPTFVFRPLTPPYMRFRIRRFLFWVPFEV